MVKRLEVRKMNKSEMPIGGNILTPGSSKEYKTGNWSAFTPVIDKKKCINCMICVHFCPEHCVRLKDGKIKDIDIDYCKGCGICAEECPVKCIKMVKKEELKEETEKRRKKITI